MKGIVLGVGMLAVLMAASPAVAAGGKGKAFFRAEKENFQTQRGRSAAKHGDEASTAATPKELSNPSRRKKKNQ